MLCLCFETTVYLQEELAKQFGIRGIPTLVILDKSGNTVTGNGRGQVMANKAAGKFSFDKDP